MMIKFTAPIKPVTWSRPQFDSRNKQVYNKDTLTEYEETIGFYAKAAMQGRPPLTGEVRLYAEFYRPKPKKRKDKPEQVSFSGDVDNYLKAVSDALNGICYVDDRQVVDVRGKKFFGKPHVIIEVEELP